MSGNVVDPGQCSEHIQYSIMQQATVKMPLMKATVLLCLASQNRNVGT